MKDRDTLEDKKQVPTRIKTSECPVQQNKPRVSGNVSTIAWICDVWVVMSADRRDWREAYPFAKRNVKIENQKSHKCDLIDTHVTLVPVHISPPKVAQVILQFLLLILEKARQKTLPIHINGHWMLFFRIRMPQA